MRGAGRAGAQHEPLSEYDGTSAFQVIILGGGGGPDEDNVTGMLVRSIASRWAKNSLLAVDAGVHLSAIIRIFEEHLPGAIRYTAADKPANPFAAFAQVYPLAKQAPAPNKPSAKPFTPLSKSEEWAPGSPANQIDPDAKLVMTTGPFKNILLPCESAKANASQILRYLISTYLITHPHLDHIAGFAINTAAFHNTSRPKKLAALPGCIDAIKTHIFNDVIWPNLSDEEGGVGLVSYTRLVEGGNVALGDGKSRGYIEVCEGLEVKPLAISHGNCMRGPQHAHHGNNQDNNPPPERRPSRPNLNASPHRRGSLTHNDFSPQYNTQCVIDSTAFFIRDADSGQEVLIFGDVEPDEISLMPRNARVWADAAPKIVCGLLKAIFIECSYDDSQTNETLYGHLTPRHLIDELSVLSEKVQECQWETTRSETQTAELELARKRKRQSDAPDDEKRRGRGPSRSRLRHSSTSPITLDQDQLPAVEECLRPSIPSRTASRDLSQPKKPLAGLKVVIIHIKEKLLDSGPISDVILKELNTHEETMGLGVNFIIPTTGGSLYV